MERKDDLAINLSLQADFDCNGTLILQDKTLPWTILTMQFSGGGGDRHPPLLLGLHLHLDITSEMNESLIKDAFFKAIHSQWHFLQK